MDWLNEQGKKARIEHGSIIVWKDGDISADYKCDLPALTLEILGGKENPYLKVSDWDEERMDVIGQNGNDGLHYGIAAATPGYQDLIRALDQALDQAAAGKGRERHANGLPFKDQPIMTLQRRYGTGYALGQAEKKMDEATRMKSEQAIHELRGAIIFLAAAILHIEEKGSV